MYGHHGCLSAIQSKLQLHSSVIDIQHQALIKCGCYIHICPVIRKHHIRIGKYMCHLLPPPPLFTMSTRDVGRDLFGTPGRQS